MIPPDLTGNVMLNWFVFACIVALGFTLAYIVGTYRRK